MTVHLPGIAAPKRCGHCRKRIDSQGRLCPLTGSKIWFFMTKNLNPAAKTPFN
jgi:hypothetical protein